MASDPYTAVDCDTPLPGLSAGVATATLTLLLLQTLILAQGALAYRAHFLTVPQMHAASVAQGLPFAWHFGMWTDVFIVSPLAAYVTGRYAASWRPRHAALSLVLGLACSAALSWLYTLSSTPEAHVQNHQLTQVGIVHLVYAAVTIAIFVQFFFFTPAVRTGLLALASLLLIVHAFVGTHMLLGLLATVVALDWYPDKPLTSIPGWITIVGLGLGLIWRCLASVGDLRRASTELCEQAAEFYMVRIDGDGNWLRADLQTPRGQLVLLNSLGGHALEFALFASAAVLIWRRSGCLGDRQPSVLALLDCLWHALLPAALVLVFGLKFFLSRISAKHELQMADGVFSPGQVPAQWAGAREPIQITLSVIFFFVLYMSLTWYADDIRLVALAMVVIAGIDYNTRRLINTKAREYFDDPRYAPASSDPDHDLVTRRRAVIRIFLLERPHLWKEAACAVGCALAFALALLGQITQTRWLMPVAYIVVIVTLLANEVVVASWRAPRDAALREIRTEARARVAERARARRDP